MIEKDITIDSFGNTLSGTICLPAETGRFPFVLMVHGTGPLDRDGNMPGQKLDVFNTIAHRLAQTGIASLRYDKRGCGRVQGITTQPDIQTSYTMPSIGSTRFKTGHL